MELQIFNKNMYSPEKSQVEICLLKTNLEEIEKELNVQRSAWPKFDAENEHKMRESLNSLRVCRALSVEIEKLDQENARLLAKRMHLNMQSQDLAKALDKARKECSDIEKESTIEKQEIEQLIRKYEDALKEKAIKFRDSRACFNEDEMKLEIEKVNNVILELEGEVVKRRNIVETKKKHLELLATNVPEDLLVTVGKRALEDKIKTLSEKCASLEEKLNGLKKN